MNSMKQIPAALFMALILALTGNALAHGGKHGGDRYPLKHLSEALELTDEQKTKLKAVFDHKPRKDRRAGHQAMQALFELDPESPEYKAELDRLAEESAQRAKEKTYKRAESHNKIMAILTPEQQAKLKALKAEKKGPGYAF